MIDPFSLVYGLGGGILIGGLIVFVWKNQIGKTQTTSLVKKATELSFAQEQLQRREGEINSLREEVLARSTQGQKLETELQHLKSRFEEREKEVKELQEHFHKEFQLSAQKALEKNAARITETQKETLQHLLNPLQSHIQKFEKQIQDSYEKEARERISLQKEIEMLLNLNQQMSIDAQNLTKALKGDQKSQGNWGELVLARVLESSGLREGEEFVTQGREMQLKDEEGKRQQPDVIVNLPENKHLIIDAKVSLTAYERWVEEEDESLKTHYIKQHIASIQRHIQGLGAKHYHTANGIRTPDFVLLFMPIEPAFTIAMQHMPDLFSHAWRQKIILVSPTTLLATLKTVASVWKLERQHSYAQEIARQGGALYDKLVGFVEEMEKVGKQLSLAQASHTQAMKRLRDGRGNLVDRAERLRELGAETKKRLKE